MKLKLTSLCLSILLPGLAHSASLIDAVNAARVYDAGISAARNVQRAGHEKYWQGLSGLLPHAQLDGNYTKQDQPTASYAAAVRRHSYTFSVTQPLFDLSKVADYKRGNVLSDSADVEYEKAQQQLIADVSTAYFDVLNQREVLQAALSAKEAFSKQLDQAETALSIGEGTRTDVDEAQANYDQAVAREVSAQNDLEVAGVALARLTGLDSDDLAPINWQCMPTSAPLDVKSAVDQAETGNLDVRAAELQVEQAKADVMSANSANLPVVSLQASYGNNWSRGSDQNYLDNIFGTTSKTRSSMIGVVLTIPLVSGGQQFSAQREAFRRRDAARDALEDARRKARQQARASYLGITNGVALVRAQERALASADSKVKSTRFGREVGMRTNIDQLNAEQRYYEAMRDLSDARYKYLKTRLQLSSALGTLSDTDLVELECGTHG
jgi:outer membrane protein